MSESAWALAGEISRRLTGSRYFPPARVMGWSLAAGGYLG